MWFITAREEGAIPFCPNPLGHLPIKPPVPTLCFHPKDCPDAELFYFSLLWGVEQSQVVNTFLMVSAGLCSTGSVLMSFNNNACPSLRAVGQAQLSAQTCICVIACAKGFLSALTPRGFKEVAVCAFSVCSVFLTIPAQAAQRVQPGNLTPLFDLWWRLTDLSRSQLESPSLQPPW